MDTGNDHSTRPRLHCTAREEVKLGCAMEEKNVTEGKGLWENKTASLSMLHCLPLLIPHYKIPIDYFTGTSEKVVIIIFVEVVKCIVYAYLSICFLCCSCA